MRPPALAVKSGAIAADSDADSIGFEPKQWGSYKKSMERSVYKSLCGVNRHRAVLPCDDKENTPRTIKAPPRLYGGTPQSVDRLIKPFRCPGSAIVTRVSEKPVRKRRKVNYAGADDGEENGDGGWTNEKRLALANRDVNKYPVFQVKDRETTFRKRFSVPLIN